MRNLNIHLNKSNRDIIPMHIDWSQRKHASLLLDFWTAMVNHPVVECLARTIPLNHSSMGDAPKAETGYSEKEISLIFLLWRCPLTWGFQFSVLIELPPPPNLKICSYNTAKVWFQEFRRSQNFHMVCDTKGIFLIL